MKPLIIALTFFLCTLQVYGAQAMSVQVKKGVLKSVPSFLGQSVGTVTYGERVMPLDKEDGWVKVRSGTAKGWLHQSALTDKKVVLRAGTQAASTGVSSNEIMLAGKGFNAQVESQYRDENPALRFDLVDTMERYKVAPKAQREFALEGKLNL